MANYTTYANGDLIARGSGSNAAGLPAVTAFEGTFDASRRNLAAADTVELIVLPAGSFVHKVCIQVITADATQTLNVGDSADPDGYVAAADVGTAGTRAIGAGAFAAAGKFYATGGTITLEVPATKALDTLKVRVVAFVEAMG